MRTRLQALAKELPCIGDVRGLGAMVAFELVKDLKTKEPDAELTAAVLSHAEARGLILLSCGTAANVVRLLAPLTIPDDILEEGLGTVVRGGEGRQRVRAEARRRLIHRPAERHDRAITARIQSGSLELLGPNEYSREISRLV